MSLIKQLKHQYSTHIRHKSDLSQTFYKKITKRYLNPTQGINSTLIKDKHHRNEKQVILATIQQQMGKQLCRLPFIENPQQWMTLGMIKNKLYCRKRGDHYHIRSSHNLERIHSQFIITQYYRKIDAIRKKNNTERSRSIPANLDKLPVIKNISSLHVSS